MSLTNFSGLSFVLTILDNTSLAELLLIDPALTIFNNSTKLFGSNLTSFLYLINSVIIQFEINLGSFKSSRLLSKKLNVDGLEVPSVLNPIGKVGIPIPGTEVKVLNDGELCIKGNHVAQGYYKSEEQTKETFDEDGWLHTGDLAEIDDDGFVKIIGRKKEILITSAGKNIAPVEIEDLVKPHPLIGQVCVVGDGKKFLSALIVLDGDGGAETWASENGIEYSLKDMAKNEKVIQAVQEQVDEANSQVANVQGIKKFVILDKEWTDSSGELTPTLKLKRNVIAEMYNDEIESMYEGIE